MARTSNSFATGIDFSTTGASSIPGMISCCPGFINVPCQLPLALRIASANSLEVRNEVCDTYLCATTAMLSPRCATYNALPGGTASGAGSAGLGALDAAIFEAGINYAGANFAG